MMRDIGGVQMPEYFGKVVGEDGKPVTPTDAASVKAAPKTKAKSKPKDDEGQAT